MFVWGRCLVGVYIYIYIYIYTVLKKSRLSWPGLTGSEEIQFGIFLRWFNFLPAAFAIRFAERISYCALQLVFVCVSVCASGYMCLTFVCVFFYQTNTIINYFYIESWIKTPQKAQIYNLVGRQNHVYGEGDWTWSKRIEWFNEL